MLFLTDDLMLRYMAGQILLRVLGTIDCVAERSITFLFVQRQIPEILHPKKARIKVDLVMGVAASLNGQGTLYISFWGTECALTAAFYMSNSRA